MKATMMMRTPLPICVVLSCVLSAVLIAQQQTNENQGMAVHGFSVGAGTSSSRRSGTGRVQQQQEEQKASSSSHLHASPPSSSHHSPLDREIEDLERARNAFENIFWQQAGDEHDDADGPHHDEAAAAATTTRDAVLTSAGRHRRKLEMLLLESLQDSDAAIDEIMHLWCYERSPADAARLEEMQEDCSPGLVEEEAFLREMVEQNPYWAEPASRLAALLYYKGRTEDSTAMCLHALELKPWHFEIYQLLVMLALRKQDLGEALYWARRGLPTLRSSSGRDDGGEDDSTGAKQHSNKRRKAWVAWALQQAQAQFHEAEEAVEERNHPALLKEEEVWQ